MAFPTTSVLDDFNRANVAPLGGNWTLMAYSSASGTVEMKLVSNAATSNGTSVQKGSDFWNPSTTIGPDCEAGYTFGGTLLAVNASDWCGLRLTSAGATPNGYEVRSKMISGAANDTHILGRVDAGVVTQLGATFTKEMVAAEKVGIEAIGSTISVYYFTAGSWTQVITTTDATYSAAGRIALGTQGTANVDDFFGGTIVVSGSTLIAANAIGSSEAVGIPFLQRISNAVAVAAAELWGMPAVQRIARSLGIGSSEQIGLPTAQRVAKPSAIASSEQVATPTLRRAMRAAAIQSGELVGVPKVSRWVVAVHIASGETWGSPAVTGGVVITVLPSVAGAMLLSDRQAYEIVLIDRQAYGIGVIDAAAFGVTLSDDKGA